MLANAGPAPSDLGVGTGPGMLAQGGNEIQLRLV